MSTVQQSAMRAPVHPLSAASLALADWLATGLNIVTAMDAYWPVAIGCALSGALAIALIERKLAGASYRAAWIKGACALPLIVLPFPFAGSLVAFALLAWWMVGFFVNRRRTRVALWPEPGDRGRV